MEKWVQEQEVHADHMTALIPALGIEFLLRFPGKRM